MQPTTHYQLATGQLLRLPAGSQLACDSGSLWITEDRQSYDAVLEPGQAFSPVGNGGLLVYAFTPAQLHTH